MRLSFRQAWLLIGQLIRARMNASEIYGKDAVRCSFNITVDNGVTIVQTVCPDF